MCAFLTALSIQQHCFFFCNRDHLLGALGSRWGFPPEKGVIHMLIKRILSITIFLMVVTPSVSGIAAEWQPYSQEIFERAKQEGKSIIVDFHAEWCGTCRKQKPVLESLLREPKFESVVALSADYDKETKLRKALAIRKQSTLVVFKGNQEAGRSLGMTDRGKISALLEKGL